MCIQMHTMHVHMTVSIYCVGFSARSPTRFDGKHKSSTSDRCILQTSRLFCTIYTCCIHNIYMLHGTVVGSLSLSLSLWSCHCVAYYMHRHGLELGSILCCAIAHSSQQYGWGRMHGNASRKQQQQQQIPQQGERYQ